MSILEDLDDSCTPFRLFTGILFFHPPRSSGKAENETYNRIAIHKQVYAVTFKQKQLYAKENETDKIKMYSK